MFTHRIDDELELRLYEDADTEELYALVDANREHIRQWMTWPDRMRSAEDQRAFVRTNRERFAKEDGFNAGIWQSGRLVGGVGFHYVNRENRKTEIGYWLAASAQGKGVMTRTVRGMVAHAFGNWKLHRVIVFAATENRRSRAVVERVGFTLEGTAREAEWLGDRFVDLAQYAMLEQEWRKLPISDCQLPIGA
jgi:ribosomal-protein-serine acetyltransferase